MSIFSSSAQLGERRGPASVAQTLYEETEASRAERERLAAQLKMAPAAFVYEEKGRPTKKDRRDLTRLHRPKAPLDGGAHRASRRASCWRTTRLMAWPPSKRIVSNGIPAARRRTSSAATIAAST